MPAQQVAVPGLKPSKSPLRSLMGLASQPPDAPLGFTLLRRSHKGLDQDFARSPLTRFLRPGVTRPPGAPEYHSTFACLYPKTRRSGPGKKRPF